MFEQSNYRSKELDANLKRHQSQCSVCAHPQCQVIEEEWLSWANTTSLAEQYHVSRDAVYRHMHCFQLFAERQKRWKFALERIIERLDMTKFNGSNVLAALKLYQAVCEREDSTQAASLPARQVLDSVPEKAAGAPAEGGASLEKPTPQPAPQLESIPAADGGQQVESAETPLAGTEAPSVEPAVTTTVQ